MPTDYKKTVKTLFKLFFLIFFGKSEAMTNLSAIATVIMHIKNKNKNLDFFLNSFNPLNPDTQSVCGQVLKVLLTHTSKTVLVSAPSRFGLAVMR